MKASILRYFSTCLLTVAMLSSLVDARTWTDAKGRKLEADFVAIVGDKVQLQRTNGKKILIPIKTLSADDQAFIQSQSSATPTPSPAKPNTSAISDDIYNQPWPKSIKCPDNFEVVTIKEEDGEYIYETPHFRFICDVKIGRTMIKKLGLMFEATHMANKALPIGNLPTHDDSDKFPAYLYEKFSDYLAAGGKEGTAGIFMGTSRPGDRGRTLVPFKSLGVKTMGKTYLLDRKQDASTLIHELTHQLMTFQAKRASWFCEGSAEYMAMTPYAGGKFNFSGNRSYIVARCTGYGKKNTGGRAMGDEFTAPPLEKFMNMPYEQFTASNANFNYGLATLLVYYFYHMDGNGDAARIKAYVKAVQSGTPEKEAQKFFLDGRTFKELEKEVAQKWRRAGIKMEFSN